ncbi:hypothetical protein V2J09_019439, partial [Rumex salicifolius]
RNNSSPSPPTSPSPSLYISFFNRYYYPTEEGEKIIHKPGKPPLKSESGGRFFIFRVGGDFAGEGGRPVASRRNAMKGREQAQEMKGRRSVDVVAGELVIQLLSLINRRIVHSAAKQRSKLQVS